MRCASPLAKWWSPVRTLNVRKIKVAHESRAIFSDMYKRGYTDGLPVIPPTEEAVCEMLDHAAVDPEDIIAVVPPDDEPLTAAKAAINAVMAGCLPEYFPVVIAAVKAVTAPEFNLLGIQTTTNP